MCKPVQFLRNSVIVLVDSASTKLAVQVPISMLMIIRESASLNVLKVKIHMEIPLIVLVRQLVLGVQAITTLKILLHSAVLRAVPQTLPLLLTILPTLVLKLAPIPFSQ